MGVNGSTVTEAADRLTAAPVVVPHASTAAHLSTPRYRADVDGLRALAVLSVIAFHAFPTRLPGGFVGVDVFFVISGFLISTIIQENLDRGTFVFAEFYARRVRRIFPALLLVLVASLTAGWFTLLADEYMELGKHVMGAAGFASNFVLWSESGYFDTAAELKPLLHLWSLGIEEQFYLVWPLMLWIAWKRKWNAAIPMTLLGIVSFGFNVWTTYHDRVGVFYSPATRCWELAFGSMLSWLSLKGRLAANEAAASGRVVPNALSAFGGS